LVGVEGAKPLALPGGFTLLEVLVAFVIAALALAVLFRGGVDALVATQVAERTDEAVSRARSRLEAVCHGARLVAGTQSGDDGGGYRWQVKVVPEQSTVLVRGTPDDPKPPVRVSEYAIAVTVSWGAAVWPVTRHGRAVTLETHCLALASAGGA
jgi:general secretion pathway protein I